MNTISFKGFLNDHGIFCYNNTLEEFLLNFKIHNKLLLNGQSAREMRSFIKIFIKYFFENSEFNDRIKSNFKVGKTITSKGFTVKRKDVFKLLPKISYEDKCDFIVDNIKVNAYLNLTPRLFFRTSENKEFYEYLAKVTDDGVEKLDYEIILNNLSSYNYKIFDVNSVLTNTNDIMEFIEKSRNDNTSNYFIIFSNVTSSNISSLIFDDEYIPDNLTIFYIGSIDNLSEYVDELAIINFDPVSPMDYLQNNLGNVKFRNLDYLENCEKEYLGNINDIKEHLQNIYVSDNKSLYNILVDELNKIYHILSYENIYISTTNINNILKYMIVSWKYENCPDIFDNWYKYFDFQIIQRIIPLITSDVSIDTLTSLVDHSSGEYNYYRSYNKFNELL